jgi:predicted NAD/FAD-binding protein
MPLPLPLPQGWIEMRIAIVGTGISGLVCAHLLHPHHDITVFEAADRIGGHTNSVRVDLADETHVVDTGFIVHNDRNYPNFVRLMDELHVATQPSDMSFSVSDVTSGLEYRGTNLNTIFAQRRNLLKPSFVRMLADIVRFNREARALLDTATDAGRTDPGESLDDFLARGRYSRMFVEQFVVPLGASIWSADPRTFTAFPAVAYAHFMDNHGLLNLRGMPEWRTVSGGSYRYVEAITRPFADRIRLGTPVQKVRRDDRADTVEIVSPATGPEAFDRVVLACHSDQSLRLLSDPTTAEREVLGAIRYQPNIATLHTDERFLPRNPRARASWNYHVGRGDGRAATLTYWMNALQAIDTHLPLLVTLNCHDEIAPDQVLGRFEYAHPVFDGPAMAAQRRRDEIQGRRGTFFAGAYWEYGFHEDGVRSALDVCRHFGVGLR